MILPCLRRELRVILKRMRVIVLLIALVPALKASGQTWTADNGNGTYSNPLFYKEFSDPDIIRVGDDYYLTGTTMHTMPGLPVLRSGDLVNWELIGYAAARLDLGPERRLENSRDAYGQGIWAPCFRHHKGTFYIFANVNGHGTQLYTAVNPAGPWKHQTMNVQLHDLTVLFDDDGKIDAVWGYDEIRMVQLTLMSLYTHCYLFADPGAHSLCSADARGARPDRKDGSRFYWMVVGEMER